MITLGHDLDRMQRFVVTCRPEDMGLVQMVWKNNPVRFVESTKIRHEGYSVAIENIPKSEAGQ